jgi:hypothetical protein
MTDTNQTLAYAEDAANVASSAARAAEHRFKSLYDSISRRSIEDFRRDDDSTARAYGPIPFAATESDLVALRDSFSEWQAFKLMWEEKLEERGFFQKHGRAMNATDRTEREHQELKQRVTTKLTKLIFYPVVLLAAIVFLVKAL